MNKAKNKFRRYKNIIRNLDNWKYYLLRKVIGFKETFNFKIKNFGEISVPRKMFGPFRENFFDNIYFLKFPSLQLNNSPIIIDIGANVGFFSLATFAKYPNAKIYAFEPHPYCFEILSRYKKLYGKYNLKIFNTAISDKDESIILYTKNVNDFITTSGINKTNPDHQIFHAKSIRLRSFVNDEGIDKIDFMKLDCEGSEYSILYTLPKEVLNKVLNICIETHKGEQINNNIFSLNKFLLEQGYKTEILEEETYTGYIWAWRN